MQSTGLIDSQGVEVFEGDVLYYPENPEGERYGIVVWQKESLAFVLETAFDYLPYNLWLEKSSETSTKIQNYGKR